VEPLQLPSAVSYIITPTAIPPHYENTTIFPTQTVLMIKLYLSHAMEDGLVLDKEQLIRDITRQYYELSWLNVCPDFSQRQSTLPLHFSVAQRLGQMTTKLGS